MANTKSKAAKPRAAAPKAQPASQDKATSVAYETPVYTSNKKVQGKQSREELEANFPYKDRTYVLISRKKPLVEYIAVKHTAKRPLVWFDPVLGYERELRYATNQPSPFVDEQEGHVTLQPLAIRDGSLFVPKEKRALQLLLSLYHPLANVKFQEHNTAKLAEEDTVKMDLQFDAEAAVKDMDIDMVESILRASLGNEARLGSITSKELRRDIRILARHNPELVLSLANDPNIGLRNTAIRAVEKNIIELGADQRTFKWQETGRRIMTVPFNENPYSALAAYFKTDEGVGVLNMIEKQLEL